MSAKGGQGATHTNISGNAAAVPSGTAYGSLPSSTSEGGGDGGGGGGGSTSPVRNNRLAYQHGHSFIRKTFRTPTNCHYCTELLWGLMGQGYICEGKWKLRDCVYLYTMFSSSRSHFHVS